MIVTNNYLLIVYPLFHIPGFVSFVQKQLQLVIIYHIPLTICIYAENDLITNLSLLLFFDELF